MKKNLGFRVIACTSAVLTDPNMLDRILRNLVSNAIHCTVSGRVLLGVRRRGYLLSIQVLDTGPGIPGDQVEAIFEEFHRLDGERREHGLGLGLAIVRRVAALLGHPIGVDSTPGKGSLFSVDVPITAAAPIAVSSAASVVASMPVAGRTILAIDDDVVVLDSLCLLLRTWGYRTLVAASFDQARDLIESTGEQPDLILADLRLSKGGDGMAAIQAVRRAAGRMIPGIILTGNTAPQNLCPLERNTLQILHKPVPPEKLGLALIQALSSRPVPFVDGAEQSAPARKTILSRA
jgi:CheY-like chemotaxis protein